MVGNDLNLKKDLFVHFHATSIGRHFGIHATRHRLSNMLYWRGLARVVKNWVKECIVCQKRKVNLAAFPSLLQLLPIPSKAWAAISMDSIKGLP